jgi:hypothetical protein
VTAFRLKRVRLMPRQLESGFLYVSEEFEVAGHLCACGCGEKVITPLGPAQWSFDDAEGGPTLDPSIGSWQLPCKSHYWITAGEVRWARRWTAAQIESGRRAQEERRREYYESRKPRKTGLLRAVTIWFRNLLSRFR